MARMAWRLLVVVTLVLAPVTVAPRADAHGDGETQEAYLLIQQALAHLAHDSGAEGVALAMEKVDDALGTDDQEGVDVAEVERGMHALEAGQVDQARELLQESIAAALADQPLATGYETGTSVVSVEMPGRGALRAADWLVLALSVAVAAVGVWMAVRFRPHDSVSALRLMLGTAPGAGPGSQRHPRTPGRRP